MLPGLGLLPFPVRTLFPYPFLLVGRERDTRLRDSQRARLPLPTVFLAGPWLLWAEPIFTKAQQGKGSAPIKTKAVPLPWLSLQWCSDFLDFLGIPYIPRKSRKPETTEVKAKGTVSWREPPQGRNKEREDR